MQHVPSFLFSQSVLDITEPSSQLERHWPCFEAQVLNVEEKSFVLLANIAAKTTNTTNANAATIITFIDKSAFLLNIKKYLRIQYINFSL